MNTIHRTTLGVAAFLSVPAVALAQIAYDAPFVAPVGANTQDVALVDLDGDGFADLAATVDAPDGIALSRGLGDGTFGPATRLLTGGGSSPHALVAADLDGDGDADLAVTLKGDDTLRVYRNDGALSFTALSSAPVGADPRHLTAADLDGDGDLDLATSNRGDDSVTILSNGGAGSFAAQTLAVGADPRSLAFADLDGDGDLDLAVAVHDDRRVELLTNGSGTFVAGGSLSTGPQLRPDGLVAADLDGDGDADLAVTGDANGLPLLSLFRRGAGGFAPRVDFVVPGANPSAAVAGDLDLDGDVDVAVLCTDSTSIALMANDGTGAFTADGTLSVGADPQHLTAGDADANGGLDLAASDAAAGSVSVFLGQARCGAFPYGVGLGGANTATLSLAGNPELGAAVTFELAGFSGDGLALMAFSAAPASSAGFAGGTLLVDPSTLGPIRVVSVAAGAGSVPATVPSDPSYTGLALFAQGAMFDGAGPEGWTLTNGLEVVVCP